jgi:FeS assembly SUF system protein
MVMKDEIIEALKKVYDPEIGIDVVNLGLIYDVEIDEEGNGGAKVRVKMTLTSPGCPLSASISNTAKTMIESVDGVSNAEVKIVWDPPWTPDMMSEEAKKILGIE